MMRLRCDPLITHRLVRPLPALLVLALAVAGCDKKPKVEATPKADTVAPTPEPDTAPPEPPPKPEPRKVSQLSGAIGVGELLPPFLPTAELSDDAALREGLAKLARSRPTRSLIKLLEKNKKAGRAAVTKAMWHEAANVRTQASQLLVRLGAKGPAAEAALRRSLRKEPDRDVRAMATKALVKLEIKALVPLLIEVLKGDKAGGVRANAAYALGTQGDKSAVAPLQAALRDPETWVRLRAVTALRRLRAKSAIPALERALADPNALVRRGAARALKALTGRTYRERLPRAKP